MSGVVALVYETLWVRQLGRVVGVDVHAVSIALSAFFGGLALGSVYLGRLADRVAGPVKLYATLEAGVATLGVLSTVALARSSPVFVSLQDSVGPLAWALPFGLVGVPAFLMGGTLPALLRSLHPEPGAVAPATADPLRGQHRWRCRGHAGDTLRAGARPRHRGHRLVRCGTRHCSRGSRCGPQSPRLAAAGRTQPAQTPNRGQTPASPADARLALALYAAAGAVALGYEVVWSEMLVQFMSTRSYAFAVMLTTYLSGLALGSYLFTRIGMRGRDPWRVLGLLLAGAALSAVAIVALIGPWLPDVQTFAGMWAMRATGRETVEVAARFVVAAVTVLLVPTTLLGAAFPAAARVIASAPRIGRDIGAILALNTAGGIAGTLLTGFVLVPRLGLVHALGALAIAGAVLGAVAILKGGQQGVAATAVAVAATIAALTPPDKLATLLASERKGTIVFYAEDTGGTVTVLEQAAVRHKFRRLYIQGVSNSGDAMTSRRYMRLQSLLPLIIHGGEPRTALVVGFGTGITAGALLADPGLHGRVVAELLPSVVRAGGLFAGNLGAATDPRSRDPHRRREAGTAAPFTAVRSHHPRAAATVGGRRREPLLARLLRAVQGPLQPDGLMAQWWPLPTQNDEDSRSLVRSFLDVFPHATAWSTELHEVLLIGSASPIRLDGERIAARFRQPTMRAAARTSRRRIARGAAGHVGDRSSRARAFRWRRGSGDRRPAPHRARGVGAPRRDRAGAAAAARARNRRAASCRGPVACGSRRRAPGAVRVLPFRAARDGGRTGSGQNRA